MSTVEIFTQSAKDKDIFILSSVSQLRYEGWFYHNPSHMWEVSFVILPISRPVVIARLNIHYFLFLQENLSIGMSLESAQWGNTMNDTEISQCIFEVELRRKNSEKK